MAHASARGLVAGLLLVAALLGLTWVRLQPPEARGLDAAPTVFSAARAAALRERLMEGLGPHRVGTPANAQLRERLLAELRALGYAPEVQRTSVCAPFGTCAPVHNLLARLPGAGPRTGERHAVMLAAHYDSVGAGPGASDDFNGTATLLEVARLLKADAPSRNDVVLLLTDGEEEGLLGARAFTRHPWSREVLAMVNVEARGTSGQSLMFETGPDNAWLVDLYARHVARPATHSLTAAVYARMPNDTDFSVLRAAGITGLNLANVGGVVHYHTPLDSVASSDPRTLQHHGDNALALMRALAAADLSTAGPGSAAYLDVLGLATLHWPLGLSPWLAGLGLVLVLAAVWRQVRRAPRPSGQLLRGALGVWGAVALGVVVGLAVSRLLQATGAAPRPWVAHPGPAFLAFTLLLLAALVPVGALVSRRAGAAARWGAVWLGWGVLALGVALGMPEASPLFLLPVLAAGLAGLLVPRVEVATLVGTTAAGVLLLQLCFLLPETLGLPSLPVVGAVAGLVLGTLLPLVPAVWPRAPLLTAATVAAGLLLALGAVRTPPYSAQAPQRLNLVYRFDQDRGAARWSLEGDLSRLPGALAAFRDAPREKAHPWASDATAPTLPAEAPAFTAPEVDTVDVTRTARGRVLTLRLRSTRGAQRLVAALPPVVPVVSVRVDGQPLPMGEERWHARLNGWHRIACLASAPEGCLVELTLEGDAPVELHVADESPGLPPGRLARSPDWHDVVPTQDGDVTVTSRTLRLSSPGDPRPPRAGQADRGGGSADP